MHTIRRPITLLALFLLHAALAFPGEREEEPELTVDDIPTRIADAEVGEWVLYKLADGSQSRLTVVEKYKEYGDTYLIIQNEVTNKGKRARVSEERVCVEDAIKDLRDLSSEDKVTEAQVLVHGRRLRAVVVNFIVDGRLVRQSYFSDKIPVYGLVKGVSPLAKARNALTLVDYGFAEDEE